MPQQNLWTKDELIVALNLYLKLPFGRITSRTPEIIHLANLIGRTANVVSMRLNNFASVDPYHQQRGVKGLTGGIKQVQPIWNEFINNKEELLFESEKILAEKEKITVETKYADVLDGLQDLQGEDKYRAVKTRVNQDVFRQIVVANYSGKCAITGIDIADLLLASHIVPWSKNKEERLNPENGICLSALYDRAFDKGYITISEDYKIVVATELKKKQQYPFYQNHFATLEGAKIELPQKYFPKKEFLQFHQDVVFKK